MNEIIQLFRKKFPGAYDSVDDDDLTLKVAEKYPQYLSHPGFSEDVKRLTNPDGFPRFKPKEAHDVLQSAPGEVSGYESMNSPMDAAMTPLLNVVARPTKKVVGEYMNAPNQLLRIMAAQTPHAGGAASSDLINAITPSDKTVAITTGIENAGADLVNFFTSPLGIGTLGIGTLPSAAQRVIALGFAAQMAKDTPELARELGSELGKPADQRDYQKIAELSTKAGANTFFTAAGVAHGGARPIAEKLGAIPGMGKAETFPMNPTPEVTPPVTPEVAPLDTKPPVIPVEASPNQVSQTAVNEGLAKPTDTTVVPPADVVPATVPQTAEAGNGVIDPAQQELELQGAADASNPQREQTIQRIKELRPEIDRLSKKGGLTATEAEQFRRLNAEANSLRYDIAKPLDISKIPSPEERKSALPSDIVVTARDDLLRNKDIYEPVVDAAIGVSHNANTSVDDIMTGLNPKVSPQDFYDAFSATREALRKQFGDSVKLFRAEGKQKAKPTQNWATTEEYAKQFGDKVVSKDIPTDNILAVNVGLGGKYHEVIVGEPPKTETQGAIATPGPQLAPVATPPVGLPPKSQRQIITDLAKGLNLPIRFGRLTTSRFGGYFKSIPNLIGSKRANDIPIASHEVGHKLDDTFKLSADRSIAAELDLLGDPSTPGSRSSWTKSKSKKYKMGEGVAEFVRYWLTDPPTAARIAPNTARLFEASLDANKDVGDVMRQAQGDIQTWRNAEPQARLRSHISVGDNPNKTRYTLSQAVRDLIDDLHFARLAVDDAQKMAGRPIPPSQNFYQQARLLRGAYGMADTFVRHGTVDFNTKKVSLGTSLTDALKGVAGRIDDFRDWIVAKRAQELRGQGRETGLVSSDIDFTANRFNSDHAFVDAFAKVRAWQDSLLKYSVDSGLVTPEGAMAMRAMNHDYVPFHRLFEIGAGESPSMETGGAGRGLNLGKPGSLKKLFGSPRDIVDPLETMVKNAYSLITASEKAAIHISLADLAHSPGMGKWVENIGTPKESVRVGLEKIREQLENAGADLTAVPDDLMFQFFNNGRFAPPGENIIRVLRGSKPEFYRLNRELFDTFHALDLEDSGKLVQLISSPAQLLRAGVTLSPDFAIANALRDTLSASIISKYGAYPFHVTLKGLGILLGDKQIVADWAAAGGRNSIEANYFDRQKLQAFMREKITKDMTPAERAMVVVKSPLTALRMLSAATEEATRLGEYKLAYDKLVKSGMPEGEARRLAAFESRDRQDFAKGGAKTKIIRRMSAFWNAGLQAQVKLIEAFRERPVATTLKGLFFITLPKMIEQALNWDDKDYWDRPQWERDLFFMIPAGKDEKGHTRFVRIPTPFEPGVIFGTIPGRVLQSVKQHNPDAVKSVWKILLTQGVPNPLPQTLQVLFADFLSGKKGWDIFRGRQVVPESIANLPPEMQSTQQTSLTAKKVGSLLGYSPMKVDHIIAGMAGGLGRQVVSQVADRAISAVTGDKITAKNTVPGARFVGAPAAVSSQAINDFYETLDLMKQEKARKTHGGGQPQSNIALLPFFEAAERDMGKWRKLSREAKTDESKAKFDEKVLSRARRAMDRYHTKTQKP